MIKYEQWPPRATGGQVAGVGPCGVKAIHYIDGIPTGIEACCMAERSQHKNKRVAQEMVHWAMASCRMEITVDD